MDRLLHALKQISERHGELVFSPPSAPARSASTALVVLEPPRTVEPEPAAPKATLPAPLPVPEHLIDWVEPAGHPLFSSPAEYLPVEYVSVDGAPVDALAFEDATFEPAAVEEVSAVEVSLSEVPVDTSLVNNTPVVEPTFAEVQVDEPPFVHASTEDAPAKGAESAAVVAESVADKPRIKDEPRLRVVHEPEALAERNAERRYYTPLAVSEAIAAVRDHILAQLVAKPTRVVGLVHVDLAGEESAIVAELARGFVGFAPGEVLAIDARSRGEGWGAKLGCSPSGGADQWLLGIKTLEQVVSPTTWAGLHAVPAGRHRHDIQAVRSAEIEHSLASCREAYHTVLIDLGSVDAMHVVPVARRCDATFLIVRLGETPRQHARTALARLQYAGVNALGCILTTAPTVASAA